MTLDSDVGKRVQTFYRGCSFPDYDPDDTPARLISKGEQSAFPHWLSEQMAFGTGVRVLDVGCGTGQLPIFLSLNSRTVIGADFTFESLQKGTRFARSGRLSNVAFVQMDLFSPALREGAFDYIVAMGVLHHTSDARGGFSSIARLVKPGGYIVTGLYNRFARVPTDLRRQGARILGERAVAILDPVARKKMRDPNRRRSWLRDQYFHPHETKHTVDEVLGWFRENDIDFISAMPPVTFGVPLSPAVFERQRVGSFPSRLLKQLLWMFKLGHEGGLFVMIGRKASRPAPAE